MTDIDPITLSVLAGRMEQIADEMDATLFRAAFNPIIAEAHDASHGLYHATSGDTLVQGKSGLPIFVGVMSFAVQAVAIWHPSGIGTMWAALCRAITTLPRRMSSKKPLSSPPCGSPAPVWSTKTSSTS
jgi:hypothetical protein